MTLEISERALLRTAAQAGREGEFYVNKSLKGDIGMTERMRRDAHHLIDRNRLIVTTAILCLIVGIICFASMLVGGAFKDFCGAAWPWVVLGIGTAAGVAFFDQSKRKV